MSAEKSEGRYTEICGATNNRGEPCGLPAGWGTPGSGGDRCKFHGGASTGPKDTDHLEDNSYAEGNPGGGAPELNTNAEIHGAFADWRTVYERVEGADRRYIEREIELSRPRAEQYSDEPPDRREELLKEYGTLSLLMCRADKDLFQRRGYGVERELKINGETYTVERLNPNMRRYVEISARRRQIATRLCLYAADQPDEPADDETKTLAEVLSSDD